MSNVKTPLWKKVMNMTVMTEIDAYYYRPEIDIECGRKGDPRRAWAAVFSDGTEDIFTLTEAGEYEKIGTVHDIADYSKRVRGNYGRIPYFNYWRFNVETMKADITCEDCYGNVEMTYANPLRPKE